MRLLLVVLVLVLVLVGDVSRIKSTGNTCKATHFQQCKHSIYGR